MGCAKGTRTYVNGRGVYLLKISFHSVEQMSTTVIKLCSCCRSISFVVALGNCLLLYCYFLSMNGALGSICENRSKALRSPKSGEQQDQMAPTEFAAKNRAMVSTRLFNMPGTRSPTPIPMSVSHCCNILTMLDNSRQEISL